MDPASFENQSGIRSTFNALPNNQELLDKMETPFAIQYTPKKDIEDLNALEYNPIRCSCGGVVNPFCKINYHSKSWFCCFCNKSNKFPSHYAQNLSSDYIYPELERENFVIEYELTNKNPEAKSSFLFLIDLAMSEANFKSLKQNIKSVVDEIDFERNEIAIVTFSRNLFVYKSTMTNSVVHSVMIPCDANPASYKKALYVKTEKGKVQNSSYLRSKYFISNKESLEKIIDSLEEDFWTVPDNERAHRATGKALDISLDLLYYTGVVGSRLVLFTSGPPTIMDGRIADIRISEFIRKPPDLEENKEKKTMVDKATKFYKELTTKAVGLRTCIDIFAFSLDEFGLFEMRDLINKTGGLIILNEEFKQNHFKEALQKLFTRNEFGSLNLHSGATLEFHCSNEIKIRGCIGNCKTLNEKNKYDGKVKIGESGTNKWFLGGLDNFSTFTFFFEIHKTGSKNYPSSHPTYYQFLTYYRHNYGRERLRVVTIEKPFLANNIPSSFLPHLDQFCIVSVFAKIAAFRSLEQDSSLVIRYLDKKLIGLLKLFKTGEEVPDELNIVPQYFYYLRKSSFVKKYASSLDEMVFYRNSILRQNIDNTLVMIQPQIIEYSLDTEEPTPVLPNLSCLKADVVLLADTFFNIIIWYGQNVKGWVDEGYHLQEGFEHIKELIEMPEEDMRLILEDRLIVPNKVKAHMGSPTERLLKSKLNPETKDKEMSEALESGNFVSDDASLSNFMARLFQVINSVGK